MPTFYFKNYSTDLDQI